MKYRVSIYKNWSIHEGYHNFRWKPFTERIIKETIMWVQTGFSIRWGWWSLCIFNGTKVEKERWKNA